MYKHMNVYIRIHVGMCVYKHISTRMCACMYNFETVCMRA